MIDNEARQNARWRKLLATFLVFGCVAIQLTVAVSSASARLSCDMISHRGGLWSGTTENGMKGAYKSYAAGSREMEFDVQSSKSNTLFAMHDRSVARTTTGTGYVDQKTSRQMQALRLDDGGRVPAIPTVLAFAAPRGVSLVLHLKRVSPIAFDRLASRIRQYGMQKRVTLMGAPSLLNMGRARLPGVRTVRLSFTPLAVTDVKLYSGVAIEVPDVTQADVDTFHAAGKLYWTFSPSTPAQWEALPTVDRAFINYSPPFKEWCLAA